MKFDQATNIWRDVEVGLLKREWGKDFKNKKVLDLGCGEGEIANQVFEKKIEWGLDNDAKMAEKARKSGVYKKVILGDAKEIPLKNDEVDLVFSNSVLEHIFDLKKVLKEVSRVLKPGGRLVATMPSDKLGEYIGWGRLYGWLFNKKYNHYHLYSTSRWKILLKQEGLRLEDYYYYLDKSTIQVWHKCLWLQKMGIFSKVKTKKMKRLKVGAGLAIKAKKI